MTALDGSTTLALTMIGLIAFLALYAWIALALSAVFRKSGEESWKAWVPVLNLVVLLQLGGLSGWLLLLGLVPGIGIIAVWVAVIVACHRIGSAFGYGPGMTVLAALLLPVWASIIGFGSSRWVGAEPRPGTRRTASEDEGLAFFAALSQPERSAPAYSPAPDMPPPPPLPGAGWTPPPRTTSPIPVASVAASALPPVPPLPPPAVEEDPWQSSGLRSRRRVHRRGHRRLHGRSRTHLGRARPREHRGRRRPGPLRAGSAGSEGAPAPIGAVPPVTRVPLAAAPAVPDEPWAPAPTPTTEHEAFADTSGPVSAIAGAPDAGGPRSAMAAVSAQHANPEIPDDAFEHTIIAARHRSHWSLVPPSGVAVPLSGEVVLLGRRPVADPDFPDAQLVSIQDGTVSKTHARLELREDRWYVTDLGSTNGVLFATVLGTEVEATPGVETEAGDRFLLGDAEVRLVRSDG